MIKKMATHLIVVIGVLGCAAVAFGQDRVHSYLNDTAIKVQATGNAVEKRQILSDGLSEMQRAVDTVQGAPMVSDEDRAALGRLAITLQEKSDELVGANGFERVPDNQLNAFSTYVVQDMEQA
jgi:hypothetical protein